MNGRRLGTLGLLLLAWLASIGSIGMCDLFRPATPESGGTGTVILTNYNDPDSTLVTMARGLAAKNNGTNAYMGGIADTIRDLHTFRTVFDQAVLSRYNSIPGALEIPDPWGDQERTFFFNFIQYKTNAVYNMTWTTDNFNPDPPTDPNAPLALIHRHYQVTAKQSDGSLAIIAVGYAELLFIHTTTGRWVIAVWSDHVDPAFGGANPPNPDQVCLGWRRLNLR
jgi:hypothetical protein